MSGTDYAEMVQKLRLMAYWLLPNLHTAPDVMRRVADAIERLVRERDENLETLNALRRQIVREDRMDL
jgi:hypothetical protein